MKLLTKDLPSSLGHETGARTVPMRRLICTSSRDLKALTDSGGLLADLYYQINIRDD